MSVQWTTQLWRQGRSMGSSSYQVQVCAADTRSEDTHVTVFETVG